MKAVLGFLGHFWIYFAEAQKSTPKPTICPIQGQQFPAPTGIAQEARFHEITKEIEETINANLTEAPFNETTFSLGMFSTTDEGLTYEYHHTDPAVANSSLGTNKVDADSIYRIASITKILTIYLWLIRDGDRRFNDPITEFVPELREAMQVPQQYATPDWEEVTVGDLAMYLAGAARDYAFNDVALKGYVTSLLPPLAEEELPNNPGNGINVQASEDPVCGFFTANLSYSPCSRDVYLSKIGSLAASFPAGYTPLYSNANFALLGLALSNLAGASEQEIFDKHLKSPLGLTGTTFGNPSSVTDDSVIPDGDLQKTGWKNALGPLNSAAGAFSTTNDLAAIGKSILNSTLISSAVTRRWWTTTTLVERNDQAVGRGWEIFRRRVNGHTVDLFTKSGNWGLYASVLFLIPSYNFGFSILTASESGDLSEVLPNVLVDKLLPALEDIAKQQADRNFAGHYYSGKSNSSITVTTDDWPALKVTQYIANGIDLLDSVFAIFGDDIDFRLVPSHLYKGKQVGFTGVYQPPALSAPADEWYWPCVTWLDIDDFTYANVPLGHIVFEVDDSGRACNLQAKALRETLERKQV